MQEADQQMGIFFDRIQKIAAGTVCNYLARVFLQTQRQHQQREGERHAVRILFFIPLQRPEQDQAAEGWIEEISYFKWPLVPPLHSVTPSNSPTRLRKRGCQYTLGSGRVFARIWKPPRRTYGSVTRSRMRRVLMLPLAMSAHLYSALPAGSRTSSALSSLRSSKTTSL